MGPYEVPGKGAGARGEALCYQARRRVRTYRWPSVLCLGLIASLSLHGGDSQAQPDVTAPISPPDPALIDRIKFLTAERLADADAGASAAFARLRHDLGHYPLASYLDARRFGKDRGVTTRSHLESLRQRLADTPVLPRVERRWLRFLARSGRWEAFLADYRGQSDADLRCYEMRALFTTGQLEAARAKARALWLTGRSQHRACDEGFDAWRKAGQPAALVSERLSLAMERGNLGLVRYLGKQLAQPRQRAAEAWDAVHHRPKRALQLAGREIALKPDIMAHAIRRLVYRDPDAAADLWHQLAQAQATPAGPGARRLAEVMFRRQRHREAAYWLDKLPAEAHTERTREIEIFNAIALERWQRADRLIAALDEVERTSEQWRFWRARVDTALGREAAARRELDALAGERSYYGFLAADRLARAYDFGDRSVGRDGHDVLAGTPAYARVRELRALGRDYRAQTEWRTLAAIHPLGPTTVAAFAHAQGWPSAAIFALGSAKVYDVLALRFPLVHRPLVERYAAERKLEPYWVMAMIRQESAFMADVRSSAGAIGLMQLMPATGRSVARRIGERGYSRGRLTEPALNIRLGTRYLRDLLDQFEHPLLAVAGYNAGPHRVGRWRPADRVMDASLWVETIPFRETRDYVKRVAYYRVIYAYRFGEPNARMNDFFAPVSPPPTS